MSKDYIENKEKEETSDPLDEIQEQELFPERRETQSRIQAIADAIGVIEDRVERQNEYRMIGEKIQEARNAKLETSQITRNSDKIITNEAGPQQFDPSSAIVVLAGVAYELALRAIKNEKKEDEQA